MSLTDKRVVVTGATGALGGAVVMALLERGAICHLPMVEPAVPDGRPWAGHPRVIATPNVALDDETAVTVYYGALPALWGSVHLVGGFTAGPIADAAVADLQKMLNLNTTTCFLGCREAVRAIRRSGSSGGGGRIVNVAARPALAPTGGMVAYAASKAAVVSITQCLAAELVGESIAVNAIAPSIIDTPANRGAMPTADHDAWPKPEQLAETIAFLVSPANALTSGTVVPVYGRA
jgi:NAD(P)-dependent dehydrogenase (short-subunit alcohol dehydrogenase family)